jgi:hypothetical protein
LNKQTAKCFVHVCMYHCLGPLFKKRTFLMTPSSSHAVPFFIVNQSNRAEKSADSLCTCSLDLISSAQCFSPISALPISNTLLHLNCMVDLLFSSLTQQFALCRNVYNSFSVCCHSFA